MNYIYIMRDTGDKTLYKFGISKNPLKRNKQLQTGNPNKLQLIFHIEIDDTINIIKAEKVIHDYLKEKGLWKRGEWFCIKDEDSIVEIAKAIITIKKKL